MLFSKFIWIAVAIIVLTPIGIFLSLSSNEDAPPAANNSHINIREVARTGVYFPLFAPPGPLWENMLIYRHAHPTLPWIAVVDPHHGPGEQYDANYAKNIEKLQAANVTVLGYVSTLWAGKSPDLVKEDISKYKDWYSVDGIMLDEMISDPGFEGLYSNYTNYAKSLGMTQVIGNVGTNISPSYAGTVDSIGTVEGDRTPPLSWLKGWQLNYDKSNFLYITYSQSWTDPEYIAESTKYIGSLYVTDDTMPFPYDDFPTYFDEVVAVLDPQGNNDLRTLSVRTSDLGGNSLDGTFATVSSSTTTDDNSTVTALRTPLAHIGNVNSTYTVTALSNSTHTFDHWDNGSTNPSRIVALDSSKVLRAYYKTPSTFDLHSNIVVNALTTQGGQLGMWISVLQGEADSGSGLTPVVAPAQEGMNYTVTANDHQNLVFDHWEDGSTNRTKTIGLQQGSSNVYLTAYYRMEKDPSLVDLTVDAYTLDGTEIRGLWSVITPSGAAAVGGLTPLTHVGKLGLTYAVEAQDYDIYTFDHWEDGSTNRTRTVALDSDTTLSAYYKAPPVDLQISFVSLPGEEGLIGMNATVTAMGNNNSNTIKQQTVNSNMTYVGGLGSVYTITVSDDGDYAFDHWEDGSTNKIRNVMLSSNSTKVIAYYRDGSIPPSSSSLSSPQLQVTRDTAEATGTFVNSTLTDGLNIPSAMEFAPDGRLFIAEQGGNVRIIKQDGLLLDTPFLSVSTNTCCESGLLGITLDPDFVANGFVYVYYTVNAEPMHNRVSRFTADPDNPDMALAGSEQPILDLELLDPNFHHGGAIHFGTDGKLYVGVGDNYSFENAQLLTTRLGKILRINSDGSIPKDNPFYDTPGARKEIWALGLRNPFTFAFSPADGRMYINDVGHDWAEEINIGEAGANYAWPRCEGACLNPEFVDPVYAYTHEDGLRKAITGGAFYEADQFPAKYRGSYFFGDYVQGFIKRLTPDGQVVDFLNATSPVDIDVGPDGSLYYLSLGTGEVRKVQYVQSE